MEKLVVHFVGPVRRPGPERTLEVDRSRAGNVGELLGHLGYDAGEQACLQLLNDGRRANLDDSLDGVTSVDILLAIGGG